MTEINLKKALKTNTEILYNKKQCIDNLWFLYESVAMHINLNNGSEDRYKYVFAGSSPWPNFIYNIDADETWLVNKTGLLCDKIREHKLPPFIIAEPGNVINDSEEILSDHGFRLVVKWPGMIYRIVPVEIMHNDKLSVTLLDEVTGLKKWFGIVKETLFQDKDFTEDFIQLVSLQHIKWFILHYNNSPVGTALINIKNNVAGFYMISVIKEYRNSGFAYYFLSVILNMLEKQGIKHAVLQANAASYSLYKKLGFVDIGNFNIYWKTGVFNK